MADVVTISSKGQVVIPAKIRGEMGIEKSDRFIIVHDRDTILLKRIRDSDFRKRMGQLLDKFSDDDFAAVNDDDYLDIPTFLRKDKK